MENLLGRVLLETVDRRRKAGDLNSGAAASDDARIVERGPQISVVATGEIGEIRAKRSSHVARFDGGGNLVYFHPRVVFDTRDAIASRFFLLDIFLETLANRIG